MKWLLRNRETLFPALSAIILALLIAVLVRLDVLTASKLAANRDALSALSSSVSMILLTIGGVFSYYRFFRGRTFFARADISIEVTVIDTDSDELIHFVVVEIKNIGTLPIWNPVPVVDVTAIDADEERRERWDNWVEGSLNRGAEVHTVVDSGEDASFFNTHRVPKSVCAVAYVAFVTAESGETWKKAVMVQNRARSKGSD